MWIVVGALRVYLIPKGQFVTNERRHLWSPNGHLPAVTSSALAFRQVVINHRKELKKMRLKEICDSTRYTSTDADAAKLLEHIDRMWPARIEDDEAPTQLRPKERRPNDRVKPSDPR